MSLKLQYTIGQVAEKTNLSIHTLRYYEKEGILPFIKRNESGIRVYEDEDIDWLKFVCALRETGMPISQLKDFVHLALQGDETIDQRLHMLEQQREKVEAQVDTLMSCIAMIKYKTDLYYNIKNKSTNNGQQAQPKQKG